MNALKVNIGNSTPGGNEALKIMGTQNIKDRITALAGSPDKAKALIDAADIEHLLKTDNTNISANSRSVLRAMQQARANPESELAGPAATIAMGAATGEPGLAATGTWGFARKLLQRMNQPNPAVDAAVARKLFNPNAAANQDTLARIMAMGQRPALAPSLVRPLAQGGSTALSGPVNTLLGQN